MKKIFGGINLTWKKLIIAAVVIGISVGLLNSIPAAFDTTINDVATYFDFWIFCGIFIIMNSKSNKEAALKCFIFFLISQPLIYLAEVPFNKMGWGLFVYYKPWFIWTLLTIPMGYIGYYMKKEKWYSLIILLPMLVLLSMGVETSLGGLIYAFPHHLINLIFVLVTLIIYPLFIFDNKSLKYTGLVISIILIIFNSYKVLGGDSSYETTLRCDSETLPLKEDTKAYLEDSKLGDITMKYEENIECYCLHAKFYKTGDTKLIVELEDGVKKEFNLHIDKNTYDLKEIE